MSAVITILIPEEINACQPGDKVRLDGLVRSVDPPAGGSTRQAARSASTISHQKDRTPLAGALRMAATAYWIKPASWSKTKRDAAVWHTVKPDADNVAKILCDALNGLAYRDDAAIAAPVHYQGLWIDLRRLDPIGGNMATLTPEEINARLFGAHL